MEENKITARKYEDLGLGAILMATTAIMLKYVSGGSRFLVGYFVNYRDLSMQFGPLTLISPLKIDMSDNHQTLVPLFPYQKFVDEVNPDNFNVLFEYINTHETVLYEDTERITLVSIGDTSEYYDMKMSFMEYVNCFRVCIRYRNDHISQDQVEKWADRLLSALDSVDYEQRTLTIPSLITRFFNAIWLSKSTLSLERVGERKSLASLRSSLNLLDAKIAAKKALVVPGDSITDIETMRSSDNNSAL
jgi:hypothetical protein